MWDDFTISNIKSNYNLKEIFSYLDYSYILKLLKNNKNLQNRIGLTLAHYKNKFGPKKYEYIKKTTKITHEKQKNYKVSDNIESTLLFICTIFCFLLPFLIYSILLVSIKTFKDSNTKDNYNKKYLNTIKIINRCLFIYDGFILIFGCIFSYGILVHRKHDYGIGKIISFLITIIINLVHILFESLVIWKLILSYKIKKGGCTWFMVLDYLFLIINLAYISIFLSATILYFKESGQLIYFKTNYILTSFDTIKISDFQLPEDFGKFPKNERKKYVFDNYKNYSHTISDEQKELITSINDFRGIKNIPLLGICNIWQIPDFLFNESSEVMIWPEQNIFKLSNKKYLFRYPIGKFEINFRNKDKSILSILEKDNLDHIQIITHKNIEYILIYELDFCKNHYTKFYSESDSDREYIYKDIFNKRSYESDYKNKKFNE